MYSNNQHFDIVSYSYIDFWLITTVLLARLSLVLLLESAFELEDSLKSPVFCLCMMNLGIKLLRYLTAKKL